MLAADAEDRLDLAWEPTAEHDPGGCQPVLSGIPAALASLTLRHRINTSGERTHEKKGLSWQQ
jgi:hypothetical protein